MEEQQIITVGRGLKRWRTEIPNLYDDSDLDPYEFRLLVHYVRVGNCYESTRTTAKKCHMSVGQVSEKRESLVRGGWITTKEHAYGTIAIGVADIWEKNFEHFSELKRSHGEQYRSLSEHHRSLSETKNEPYEEELE